MNAKLSNFLIEAKKQTYANQNIQTQNSSRKGSYDYEYTNGNMLYHDTYFGGTHFIGEEVVYQENNTPIWGMNYYGITLDESLQEEAIDKVLRPALMKVGDTNILPVRGPKEFIQGDYKYTFTVTGDLNNFSGQEIIYKNNKKIYELKCHGGAIKK